MLHSYGQIVGLVNFQTVIIFVNAFLELKLLCSSLFHSLYYTIILNW